MFVRLVSFHLYIFKFVIRMSVKVLLSYFFLLKQKPCLSVMEVVPTVLVALLVGGCLSSLVESLIKLVLQTFAETVKSCTESMFCFSGRTQGSKFSMALLTACLGLVAELNLRIAKYCCGAGLTRSLNLFF